MRGEYGRRELLKVIKRISADPRREEVVETVGRVVYNSETEFLHQRMTI